MQSQTAQHQLPKVSYFYEFLWDINNFKDQVGPEHFKNVSTTLLFDPLFESGNFYVRYGMHYLLTGKTPVVKNIKPKQYLDPNLELVAAFTVDENYYMYGRVLSPGL